MDLTNLESALKRKWSELVPRAYSRTLDASQKEVLQKSLISHLEEFLTKSSTPSDVFDKLKAADDPPLYCGRAFRNGEPTYSCRDCALDQTCVLCMQCFDKSVHKQHKYKINTSLGSGYCDCGDVEAWKQDPACSDHDRANVVSTQDPEQRLPSDLRERAEVLVEIVLRYCYEILMRSEYNRPPADLTAHGSEDASKNLFYVMLLNDEIHTYDQVITRLMKSIGISHKEAVEFATTVDREGRACVYTGTLVECEKISASIQRKFMKHDKKILEALVMHHTVVAHQEFAQVLLKWLETIITNSDGLRRVFCQIAMKGSLQGRSLLEQILLADTTFWKAVRLQFHQLFMSGVSQDLESKTKFAILFTKHYTAIYSDFVRDDHYRSVSATAVSVQLYTVTTIVKLLIEKHGLIEVILKTILKESERWRDSNGTLCFERRHDAEGFNVFKRVQFALPDLKYALSCGLPNLKWNDDLKSAFLTGFASILDLFSQIQGMDGMKRFTAKHIEYEPEWETAFSIQLKTHDCITLLLRWCSTDKDVLLAAYAKVLQFLPKNKDKTTTKVTIAGHSADCCQFEVGGPDKFTSIHQPLHRLLAGLTNALPDAANFTSPLFAPMNQQLELADLLEPVMRVQVLIAQVQADMWKRNGYSILNQIYYYQYVKCRQEMYDRDIQLIQSVAAQMDPNTFLIHALNKFNLASVVQPEQSLFISLSVKQTIALLDEFLQLLIIILGERYVVGMAAVTPDQIIQREIIHQLAINRMSHSDLDKNLPEDPNSETNLEANVQVVAEFNRAGAGKGMYSLKNEYRESYNPCFYHYSKAEQSKAEDFQRQHRANNGLDQVLPVPMPPVWLPKFAGISRLFTCDVMLFLIHNLLTHMIAKRSRLRAESHFERVLHLITMALHEDKLEYMQGNRSLRFVFASQVCVRRATELCLDDKLGSVDYSILDLLYKCANCEHITHEPIKELLQHVLKYISSVANISADSASLCPLRSVSSLDSAAQLAQDRDRQRRATKAAKSRTKMLERMARQQRKFMKDSASLFEECSTEPESQSKEDSSMMDIGAADDVTDNPIALGVNQTRAHTNVEDYVCIVCQEASNIHDDSAVVYAALVQRSTVMSRDRTAEDQANAGASHMLFVPSDLRRGTFVTTCGHPMHANCFQSYYDSAVARELGRAPRGLFVHRQPTFDVEKGEFFCPLCDTIANTVLPVLPSVSRQQPDVPVPVGEVSLVDWLTVLAQLTNHGISESAVEENCPLPDLAKLAADTMYTNFIELFEYLSAPSDAILSDEMSTLVMKFLRNTLQVYRDKQVASSEVVSMQPELASLIWNTTAYTIQVIEQLIRSDGKPLFGHLGQRHEMCISLLVRFAAVCHKAIAQMTVRAHCQTLLRGLLLSGPPTVSSMDISKPTEDDCIIDIDAWHYLVSLCFAMPSLFAKRTYLIPAGSVNESYLLHLLLSVHMTQIMLGYTSDSSASPLSEGMDVCEAVPGTSRPSTSAHGGTHTDLPDTDTQMDVGDGGNDDTLVQVFTRIYSAIGLSAAKCPSAADLQSHLISASLPFLRCAAMLFSNLTDVPAPPALHALCSPTEEYAIITKYLAIPSAPSELFTDEITQILVNKCNDSRVMQRVALGRSPVMSIEYPLKVNSLIDLPENYSDLINSASLFKCPNSMGSDESRTPTMCLVCGQMLCSQGYCCQVEQGVTTRSGQPKVKGAASVHSITCGAGNCIFLRVRQCQVLLLSGRNKGMFLPAPYVDDYGETDMSLKRGNPLRLCKTAYKDLHRLWLSHSIPAKVAKSVLDASGHMIAEWPHF